PFFFQADDGIRDFHVTGVQTCALPICPMLTPLRARRARPPPAPARPTDDDSDQALAARSAAPVSSPVSACCKASSTRSIQTKRRSEERRVGTQPRPSGRAAHAEATYTR